MKKVLIAGLIAVADFAQAKDINLDCSEKELNWKISFNTATSKGMMNNLPSEMRASDTEYSLFSRQGNMSIEFRVNRETLDATIIRVFTGSLAELKPLIGSGRCAISAPKNNLI